MPKEPERSDGDWFGLDRPFPYDIHRTRPWRWLDNSLARGQFQGSI